MCGVIAWSGKIDLELIKRVAYESGVRGLHHQGSVIDPSLEAGIIHTRYITSGETNQPLSIGDGRWMAFNGVIDMGTKREMEERYNITMDSDNDGEIILRKCKTPEQVVEFLRNSKATFAGVFLEGKKLYAIRNAGRPLWMARVGYERFVIASTKDILVRAGITALVIELLPLTVYQF